MSKMKQHLEEKIVITYLEEENTGWKRQIFFEYEGNKYEVNSILGRVQRLRYLLERA
jgi:hypothetical protein